MDGEDGAGEKDGSDDCERGITVCTRGVCGERVVVVFGGGMVVGKVYEWGCLGGCGSVGSVGGGEIGEEGGALAGGRWGGRRWKILSGSV